MNELLLEIHSEENTLYYILEIHWHPHSISLTLSHVDTLLPNELVSKKEMPAYDVNENSILWNF